jgi:hypothetical protein
MRKTLYEKPIMDRFGLMCYGFCKPLDLRWHIVKDHHHKYVPNKCKLN